MSKTSTPTSRSTTKPTENRPRRTDPPRESRTDSSRVLGVDPGSFRAGWGLLGGTASRPELLDCGVLVLGRRESLARRLDRLQREFAELVRRTQPTAAAVETPFHGVSARAALRLAHARGVILAVLGGAGVEVAEYSPATIKKAVAGSGRADKNQVGAMVCRLLGGATTGAPHDLTDALAVALCHLSTAAFQSAVDRTGERR